MNLFKAKTLEVRDAAAELLGLIATAAKCPSSAVYDLASGLIFDREIDVPIYIGDHRESIKRKKTIGKSIAEDVMTIRIEAISEDHSSLKHALIVLSAIVSRTGTESYSIETAKWITKAMNASVTPRFTGSRSGREPLLPDFCIPIDRIIADKLVHFALYFVREPQLIDYMPIGCCPTCKGVFLIRKRGQEYCSSKCYGAEWNKNKKGEDPRYFADKAKENRLAHKAMAAKRAKQRK